MKERPILFSGPMVRAILDGRKTQTRRPVKPQLFVATPSMFDFSKCPLGQPGERLWVRETWMMGTMLGMHKGQERPIAIYRADGEIKMSWRPSIHMPRWASRITLEITRVWVERVRDITEEDAMKEGCIRELKPDGSVGWGAGLVEAKDAFRDTWQSIYGTWDDNPWVWAVEFRRTK